MSRKNNLKDLPNTYDQFGFVLGYDYQLHMWIYDVKYYLIDNNWYFDPEGKEFLREISDRELKSIERHKNVIEEHERENTAWLNHKKCRKISCVCKRCEKYCHCYDCIDKIVICDNVFVL